MEFINRYDAKYVLILSGDHIYKMDYAKMLAHHKESGADCTIAVLDVPIEEASRFGIMSVNEDGSVWKFSEKPKNPDSTKASMGIYIFNTKKLLSYLEEDEKNPDSENDFGKNIIPAMLGAGERMFAYPFSGYWKDVGTITSLWEANMDMLGENPALVLNDDKWRIYARHYAQAPQFISKDAEVSNSSITEGCEIYGKVKNSVLGVGVRVMEGAEVVDSVIMSGATIDKNAVVKYSIVDSFAYVGEGVTLGADRAEGVEVAVVGAGVSISAGENVPQGAMLYGE
jgi:glucose-1-phosphate adenylyltransferase